MRFYGSLAPRRGRRARGARQQVYGAVLGLPLLVALCFCGAYWEQLHAHASVSAGDWQTPGARQLSAIFKTEPEQCADTPAILALPYLAIVLYSFVGVAVITDDYFEPTLTLISEDLGLSSDVAGATFMAAGSSAPELLTSFVDAFLTRSSVGIGTILGSAMFNILVIVGGSALVGKQKGTGGPLRIAGWPLGRDSAFYLLSLAVLTGVIYNDGQVCVLRDNRQEVFFNGTDQAGLDEDDLLCYVGLVTPVEGLLLALLYFVYIAFMVYNTKLQQWYNDNVSFLCCARFRRANAIVKPAFELATGGVDAQASGRPTLAPADRQLSAARLRGYTDADVEEEEEEFPGNPFMQRPASLLGKLYHALALPFYLLYWVTVPAYMKAGRTRNFTLFTMCMVWISALTVVMVYFSTFAGCLLEVDPFIIGVVILAAGTSVPDALASFVVARDGYGDMAISNALGSNVFNIMLALGLPWLLSGLVLSDAVVTADGKVGGAFVVTNGVLLGMVLLVGALFLFVGSLVLFDWVMYRSIAVILLAYYAGFLMFVILANRCQIPVCMELDCARCGNEPAW